MSVTASSGSSSRSSSDPFIPVSPTRIPAGIDPKLFSILQQKVESLELTTNFIQQKADQKKLDSEALIISTKNSNSVTNKKIIEEIKKLNEKIDILEKQNIEKKIIKERENKLKVKSLTADDIIEEITKNEEIQNLQNEVNSLNKIYKDIENLEKKSNDIEQISKNNSEKFENLSNRIEEISLENKIIEKNILETPLSFQSVTGSVKDFAAR